MKKLTLLLIIGVVLFTTNAKADYGLPTLGDVVIAAGDTVLTTVGAAVNTVIVLTVPSSSAWTQQPTVVHPTTINVQAEPIHSTSQVAVSNNNNTYHKCNYTQYNTYNYDNYQNIQQPVETQQYYQPQQQVYPEYNQYQPQPVYYHYPTQPQVVTYPVYTPYYYPSYYRRSYYRPHYGRSYHYRRRW